MRRISLYSLMLICTYVSIYYLLAYSMGYGKVFYRINETVQATDSDGLVQAYIVGRIVTKPCPNFIISAAFTEESPIFRGASRTTVFAWSNVVGLLFLPIYSIESSFFNETEIMAFT